MQDDLSNIQEYAEQLGWFKLFEKKGKPNKEQYLVVIGIASSYDLHVPEATNVITFKII